jgi:hypothetical protein
VSKPTALYRCFDAGGDLLYIGITLRYPTRWREHSDAKSWWTDVASMTLEWFGSWTEAEVAERTAILAENPRHNVDRWQPDRSRILPLPVWEPLPADLRKEIAAKARKYASAKTLTSRIALAMVVHKGFAHGCRPGAIAHAAGMSSEQVKGLAELARREKPDLPPIISRHGSGRQRLRVLRAARRAS